MKAVDISSIEKHYRIEEDGAIWSYRLGRYLRPTFTGGLRGKAYVVLPERVAVDRLVAEKYIGVLPEGRVIEHINGNVRDNKVGNLRYSTRREVLVHNRKLKHIDRDIAYSWVEKGIMSQPRGKAVECNDGRSWPSIGECASDLGISRVGLWKALKRGGYKKLKLTIRPL